MVLPDARRRIRFLATGLATVWFCAVPALAQASVIATCTVRIVSSATQVEDMSSAVLLKGRVVSQENGQLLLRMTAGLVRVEVGRWDGLIQGEVRPIVNILADRRQENGRQRLLARKIFLGGDGEMTRGLSAFAATQP
jgi:hypothetical protein